MGLLRGSATVYCKSTTAHCPKVVQQCVVRVPQPTPQKQCSSVWDDFHYPLPPDTAAVYCKG